MNVGDKPVLYRPKPLNFKAIDGMIVLIEPDKNAKKNKNAKPKLLIFPTGIISRILVCNSSRNPTTSRDVNNNRIVRLNNNIAII